MAITRDINAAMDDYNTQDYFGFGEQIGEALVAAVGSDPYTPDAAVGDDCHGDDCPDMIIEAVVGDDCHGDDCPDMIV